MFTETELKERIFQGLPDVWREAAYVFYCPKNCRLQVSVPGAERSQLHVEVRHAKEDAHIVWDGLALHTDFQGIGYGRRVTGNVVLAFREKFGGLPSIEADTCSTGSYTTALMGLTSPYFKPNGKALDRIRPLLPPEHRAEMEEVLALPPELQLRGLAHIRHPAPGLLTASGKQVSIGYALSFGTRWYGHLRPDDHEGMECLMRYIGLAGGPGG